MPLPPGTKAPDFTLPTKTAAGAREITLSANFGRRHTVLLFFPMIFTDTCTAEMCAVSRSLADYEKLHATVYGISGDNPFAQEAWAQKEGITLTLLSDYEHAVARAYGVAYDSYLPQFGLPMGGVAKRSVFVIDRDGLIQEAVSDDDARNLPDFEKIKARLAELG